MSTFLTKVVRRMVRTPHLGPGEQFLLQMRANRETSPARVAGGMLFVSNVAVYFEPHFLDRLTGIEGWRCSVTDIVSCGRPKRALDEAVVGGLASRLSIEFADKREVFVLPRPDDVGALLKRLHPDLEWEDG